MTFFAGQRVVCLNSEWEAEKWWDRILEYFWPQDNFPVKDGIYTVRTVTQCSDGKYLSLVEFADNYQADQFCPLEYKAMEIFRKIAANPKVKIDA